MPFFLPNSKPAALARPERQPWHLDFELSKKGDGRFQLKIGVRRNTIRFVTNNWERARPFVHPAAHSAQSVDLIQMVCLRESGLHSESRHAILKVTTFSSTIFTKPITRGQARMP